ncbi:MAG: HlyD family efflux transporter periplasmic adaptor subunit [Oscillospiraceae bacterium]|nr:HlyD family efflux transporter periplasmic adaptor subunit [Oscillospiraceae bacterium]
MNKQLILKITGIISAALVSLTFASRTIYSANLPVVNTVAPKIDVVPLTAKTSGTLDSEAAVEVLSGGDWRVNEVFVGNGERVSKGDLLFSIDTKDLEIYKKTKELEILRLENSLDALNTSSNTSGASSVNAPFDGRLLDVQTVYTAQRLSQGQVLGRFVDDSAFVIPFYFSIAYADILKAGNSVSVSLSEWMSEVTGVIESVSDSDYIVNGARTVLVKVRISNAGSMTEGAYAAAEITDGGEVIFAAEPSVLKYAREDYLLAPISGVVTQTNLREGSRFNRGARLLSMSPETVQQDARAAQRSIAELTVQHELALMQLEQLVYPADGIIYAEQDGTVFNMAVKKGARTVSGERLLSILPENAPLTVSFTLSAKEGADFGLGLPVSVVYYALNPEPKTQRHDSAVRSYRLSDDGGSWEYTAVIDAYDGAPLMDMDVEVTVGHSGEMYSAVVPISAVSERIDGPRVYVVKSRSGLFGDEFYVEEVEVSILASNPYVAALDKINILSEVVTYTSRPIMNGDTVRIEGQ